MKSMFAVFVILFAAAPAVAQQQAEPPKSFLEKVSYTIGMDLGKELAGHDVMLNMTWLVRGVQDGMKKDAQPLITQKEQQDTMVAFQQELFKRSVQKNKDAGERFLAANGKKQGVVTTDSGLQYQVVKRGTGASPKATDTVKVHYTGKLLDGTVFDSSVQRGEPAEFPVNRVIKGWTEALQLMRVGDKWQLFIPSDLAYGERGAGGSIGPHATLVFDVELLDIVK